MGAHCGEYARRAVRQFGIFSLENGQQRFCDRGGVRGGCALPDASFGHVALNQRATEGLSRFERVHIVGPADARRRSGVCNFYIEGIESRGLARVLDERANVMVRHGKHCVHAWYGASGVPESVRATFAAYNTPAEVDKLVRTIGNVVSLLG